MEEPMKRGMGMFNPQEVKKHNGHQSKFIDAYKVHDLKPPVMSPNDPINGFEEK